jgi:UDP-hydrolysing UDP-N-acetyl-D-glucosamine 2-epimerase
LRTVGVVTVGRSDYGIYLPVLRRMLGDDDLQLSLLVSGAHLSARHGYTVSAIERDGMPIAARIPSLDDSDEPDGIARSIGNGIRGFSEIFARSRPDILLVNGDRFEMYAAAVAALPFTIPVGHIHGGEVTEGAIDDALRHSMSKLSHLHFATTELHARRLRQLGEEPWRVVVSGAPALDQLDTMQLLSSHDLEEELRVDLSRAPLLVTFHPVTLEFEQTERQTAELLLAIDSFDGPIVITAPNADTRSTIVSSMMRDFAAARPRVRVVSNLGTPAYFSLMSISAAMVGNSSSGIIEAPSFSLPVVNVGNRQKGRMRGANVIDVPTERTKIVDAIRRALSSEFRKSAAAPNPYRAARSASEIIVNTLKSVDLSALVPKRFCDLQVA